MTNEPVVTTPHCPSALFNAVNTTFCHLPRSYRLNIIRAVAPSLVKSSLNLHGTRSVQKVVEIVAADAASSQLVTAALAPQAARLCIDANGNHVIQRILQVRPYNKIAS